MAYSFTNPKIQKVIPNTEYIVSPKFKGITDDYNSVLSGAYITYQVSPVDLEITTLDDTPTNLNPIEGLSFSYNTLSKETKRYTNGSWGVMSEDVLEVIIEAGFTATWRPMTTVLREDSLEVLIPAETMPVNIESSQMLFVGFKREDLAGEIISPAMGMPITSIDRYYSRSDNTTITFPFNYNCNLFFNTTEDIDKLENSKNFDTKHKTILELLADYNSSSSSWSDLDSVDLSGSILKL